MSLPREVLAKYIQKGDAFLECGSRWGDTLLEAWRLGASPAWGCESDGLMWGVARAHVEDASRAAPELHLYHDLSINHLKRFACWSTNSESSVVFLDAHTDTHSPLMAELEEIRAWQSKPRVILIDDVRLFSHWGLSLEAVCEAIFLIGDYRLEREAGIVPEDVLVAHL